MYKSIRLGGIIAAVHRAPKYITYFFPRIGFHEKRHLHGWGVWFNWLDFGAYLIIPRYINKYRLNKAIVGMYGNPTVSQKLGFKDVCYMKAKVCRIKYSDSKAWGQNGWIIAFIKIWLPFFSKTRKGVRNYA